MASTASTLLLLELMADGENENTWGQKTNTNLSLLENAVAKRVSIALGSSDVTLSDTQFADNQARSLCLAFTGTLSANVAINVPARSKMYLVTNGTSGAFSVTIKTSAGTGVTVAQGSTTAVYCDGTNVVAVQASVSGTVAEATNALNLGGVAAANYARLDAYNTFSKGFATTFVVLADGGTVTLNASLSNAFSVTLAGNRTLDITNPVGGQQIELWVIQDAVGGRTLTWPASVLFEGGRTPALATAASAINRFFLTYNSTLTKWIATRGEVAGSGSTITLSITANTHDIDLYALAGQPGSAATVNVTVEEGVLITSSSAATPAIDTRGFAAGSVINITNFGYIQGTGGDGGMGAIFKDITDSAEMSFGPRAGRAGGNAIMGPGASRTLNIINASGFIWGGGGGGGGGGVTGNQDINALPCGGGGGGGAGGGRGGDGVTLKKDTSGATSSDGVSGSRGRLGTFGTGGAAASSGSASGGAGGAGGDWGAAGAAGASPTSSTFDFAGGAAGAAGKAVEPNGGTVNIVSGSGSPNIKGATS